MANAAHPETYSGAVSSGHVEEESEKKSGLNSRQKAELTQKLFHLMALTGGGTAVVAVVREIAKLF